jgi:teichuronic acid biosynthesis glycosyltransferase TuaC
MRSVLVCPSLQHLSSVPASGIWEPTSTKKHKLLPHLQYPGDPASRRGRGTIVIEKLRILAVTNTYPTAEMPGETPQIQEQIEALKARGVRVDQIHVDRLKGIRGYAQAAWRIFRLSFQRKRYDLIHAYYGHCGLLARLQVRYPIVVTFLGSDILGPRDGAIGRPVARLADGIIVQSEEMKRRSKRNDACIIPFGVNLDLFISYPMEDARRELGLALDEKLILFPWDPARTVKRFDLVQEAVQIVQQRYDRVRLVVVFEKPHETVAKYMSACDVIVLASDHEGSPMALREAMVSNLPIVSVDVGDVRQIIENTEGCYLCKRDPSDIAEKLGWALERRSRTDGARVIRQADVAWGADQVMLFYNRVLSSRKWLRQGAT